MAMKSFILKTLLFSAIVIGLFVFILTLADGHTDPYYLKFTTPPQDNIILGTSRGAQAVQPAEFESVLNEKFLNYSFTIGHSPYGPVYLNSVKKKVNPHVTDGIFVVTVDPWSISNNGEDPNDPSVFIENDLFLADLDSVNKKPNFEYLYKHLKGKYYTAIFSVDRYLFLHDDGWLEVDVPMDSSLVRKRLKGKIEEYRKINLPDRKLSEVRVDYLKQTVEFLKSHGKVYLVRLPISPEMYEIEQEFLPNFNDVIYPVTQISDGYLDMSDENHKYQYTDGNHLWKESGKAVSKKIAEWIKESDSY
jgi:hypothetical protein